MKTSEQVDQIATALAKAQGAIKGAVKDSANPFFKSSYADLAAVWEACRGPLSDNGLSVVQMPYADGNRVTVSTRLLHSSGQWVEEHLTLTAKEDSAQAVGSAITYARRYALAAAVGVAPEDDDGEAAEGRQDGKQLTPAKVAVLDEPQTVIASIDKVSDWKPTTNPKVKRREFVLDDGKKLSVVSVPFGNERLGDLAAQLATDGDRVELTYKHGRYGLDLLGVKRIKPVTEEEPQKEMVL